MRRPITEDRVLDLLSRGALTTGAVAETLGVHHESASALLRKLRQRHLVTSRRAFGSDGRGFEWRRHWV
jgi:predicted ArsR family transcriptional regulator